MDRLLDRAYGESQRLKRIKVLINPYGGAGKAAKLYARDIEPIFAAAQCDVDVEHTAYRGHAVEIAEKLDENDYDVIATCSGDGLPHEVFNGLARKPNAIEALHKVAVVQLPCGTGNAMSWSLNGTGSCSVAALNLVKGLRTPLDLASVTQGHRRTVSFLSQSIGLVADVDLGTDNIRWMGSASFTYGFLVRLLGKRVYPCEIAIKTEVADKASCKAHYAAAVTRGRIGAGIGTRHSSNSALIPTRTGLPDLQYGTAQDDLPPDWTLLPYPKLGNFYSGNMSIMAESAPFFPAALPSDGLLDLITIDGDISRISAITLLFAVEKGTFFDNPHVNARKVSAFRVIPRFGKWDPMYGRHGVLRKSKFGRSLTTVGIRGAGHDSGARRDGGYISIDGEKIPFEPFQVEVHQGLGTVLSRSGFVYESAGPSGWESMAAPIETADHAPA